MPRKKKVEVPEYTKMRMRMELYATMRLFGRLRLYTGALLREYSAGGRPSTYCKSRLGVLRKLLETYNAVFPNTAVTWAQFTNPKCDVERNIVIRAVDETYRTVQRQDMLVLRACANLLNDDVPLHSLVTMDLRDLDVYKRTVRYRYDPSVVEWDECQMFGGRCLVCDRLLVKRERGGPWAAHRELLTGSGELAGFSCRSCHERIHDGTRKMLGVAGAVALLRQEFWPCEMERSPNAGN